MQFVPVLIALLFVLKQPAFSQPAASQFAGSQVAGEKASPEVCATRMMQSINMYHFAPIRSVSFVHALGSRPFAWANLDTILM
jgi:hypothetical protein